MKKLLVVLAILFIGISLAGCISDPVVTPPLTPAPTTNATTVLPTEIPTVLPTANVTSNVTATETPNATETPQPVVPITFNEQGTITPGTIVSIPVGTTVSWINNDRFKPHAVVAVDLQTGKYFGSMSTVEIPYGKAFNVSFDNVGAYNYATVYQPATTGIIRVTAK
ncbi:MAG: hypothetical protein METHP_01715 [Methanoregula sp. SKADARSKE-2]|nr:MAG: hypothetical protein METHP_01715 [Methanoregula sp. SKADARSKE-2]